MVLTAAFESRELNYVDEKRECRLNMNFSQSSLFGGSKVLAELHRVEK